MLQHVSKILTGRVYVSAILFVVPLFINACSKNGPSEEIERSGKMLGGVNKVSEVKVDGYPALHAVPSDNTYPTGMDGDLSYDGELGDIGPPHVSFSSRPNALSNPVTLDLAVGEVQILMTVGETRALSHTLRVENTSDEDIDVAVKAFIDKSSGLEVETDDTGFSFGVGEAGDVIHQSITAYLPGKYQVQTEARILSTGMADSEIVFVTVLSDELQAKLIPLGVLPDTLGAGETRNSIFTAQLIASRELVVNSVRLYRVDNSDSKILQDIGEMQLSSGQDALGVRVYSIDAEISGDSGNMIYYKAVADISGFGPISSSLFYVGVSNLPIGISAPLPDHEVVAEGQLKILDNELLVSFIEGVNDSEIESIMAAFSGLVVGSMPSAGIYQVRFPGVGGVDELYAIRDEVLESGKVKSVDYNVIGGGPTSRAE